MPVHQEFADAAGTASPGPRLPCRGTSQVPPAKPDPRPVDDPQPGRSVSSRIAAG